MKKKTEIDLMNIDPRREGAERVREGKEAPEPSPAAKAAGFAVRIKKIHLLMAAGILILLGGAAVAGLMGWLPGTGSASAKAPPARSVKPPEIGPTLKLTSLIVNLKEGGGRHYIKTTIVVEITGEDFLEEVKSRTPSLVDAAILTIGDQKLNDLLDPAYKEKLKDTLVGKMNQHFLAPRVKRIYFDEFLYQ